MNKHELITDIAERSGFTKTDTQVFLRAFSVAVMEEMARGGSVQIQGFGTFAVKERKSRIGVNPHTHEKMKLPRVKIPAFKAGKPLKDIVKGK